jgi:predicted Zn-dependent protease
MGMTATDSRALCERIFGLVNADSAEVRLAEGDDLHLRHASNDVTSNALVRRTDLSLTVSYGRRSATLSTNRLDDASIRRLVERAEAMAAVAPENPEHMPPLGPAEFVTPATWAESTATAPPQAAISWLRPVIERAREAGVDTAGYLKRTVGGSTLATSSGLFVHQRSTTVGFSVTARTPTGHGSGWASTQVTDIRDLDLGAVGDRAIQKALASRNPSERPPGRTTVVLEPAAVRDLVSWLVHALDRRPFDEGRSFLCRLAGGDDPVGRRLFDARATIVSDPLDKAAPCPTHAGGLPLVRTPWIEAGVLESLAVGRFWAQKRGMQPQPGPGNLIMTGEGRSLDDLVGMVDDGVLVTRIWYLRSVDPQTLLLTGLTRDGTFAISKGRLAGPVKNFRFNVSPVHMLERLVASGVPTRMLGAESDSPVCVPPLVIEDFNLSSVSDAS